MPYLLNSQNVKEENINIKGIPCIRLVPKESKQLFPTIIFYHGWGSSKESQRFRGFILSNLGYQVIIPDAIHHGKRNPIDYKDPDNTAKYFWKIILSNIEEFDWLEEDLINKYDADPDHIGVMGHSMGGFTSAGVFTHNENVKTSVILNGSLNWAMSNEIFAKQLAVNTVMEEGLIEKLDPMNNLHKIIDRPLLILHGGEDKVVCKAPQEVFYEKIKPLYKDESKINMTEYPYLGHFVTSNMLEDGTNWMLKWLRGGR